MHLGTDTQAPAEGGVIVATHVDKSARREVRINLKLLVAKNLHTALQQLAKIVRQYHTRQRHCDAFRPLRQQQRELHRQRHWLLLPSVVARLPLRRFGIEHNLLGELRQPRLDVTTRSGIVARQNIAPVTLTIDKQVFLPHIDQSVLDAHIAVGVVLHRITHDIGHLREASVVRLFHSMEDSPLHRLQSVVDIRHRAVEDDITGIVYPVVFEHAT